MMCQLLHFTNVTHLFCEIIVLDDFCDQNLLILNHFCKQNSIIVIFIALFLSCDLSYQADGF